jgi:hypothetical protein
MRQFLVIGGLNVGAWCVGRGFITNRLAVCLTGLCMVLLFAFLLGRWSR